MKIDTITLNLTAELNYETVQYIKELLALQEGFIVNKVGPVLAGANWPLTSEKAVEQTQCGQQAAQTE